jgi:2-polyprenyl-3-methyl-5-hydroxy-6-metoxy-1,4-benzoquinol methylase
MNPQVTDVYLDSFYSSQHIREKNHLYDEKSFRKKAKKHELNLQCIEEYLGSKGKILSIGCGSGTDLRVAKDRGWQVEGYEVNEDFIKKLQEKFGINARGGNFLDLAYKEEEYDCVYMHQVLEHPKNVAGYLDKVYKILKKGGIFFVACPNINAISIKIKRLKDALNLSSVKGKYYDAEKHLSYFYPRLLADYLQNKFHYELITLTNDFKMDPETLDPIYSWQDKFNIIGKSSFRLFLKK